MNSISDARAAGRRRGELVGKFWNDEIMYYEDYRDGLSEDVSFEKFVSRDRRSLERDLVRLENDDTWRSLAFITGILHE